jgi:hypothetical protein
LDNKLQRFNQVFRWLPFTSQFDFVFLTHYTSRLIPRPQDLIIKDELLSNPDFPLPGIFLSSQGMEFLVYPELVHFREVHDSMTNHPLPDVRAKFLAAWNMYCLGYPKLMRSLVDCQFAPEGLAEMDWSEAKQQFDEDRVR